MAIPERSSERGGARRLGEWVGLALHVLVGFFPYGASGLVAPLYGMVVLYLVWTALLVLAWRWRPANPWAVLLVPLVAVALWFAFLSLGEAVFNWTA
jgi:hypothetical protein